MQHEIAENITSIEKNVAVNTVNIATNTDNITTNAASITTNAYNIAANAASITTNADNIAANTASITTNADSIAANAASITTNADNIAANAASITTNADSIAANKEAIAENSVIVCDSSGWTRVAYLDMSHPSGICPTGFGLYNEGVVRACGKQTLSDGCDSVTFSTYDISYSEVCGRVIGYQYGRPDGVTDPTLSINNHYVDGISITRGSPRKHIWTLMASHKGSSTICPCDTGSNTVVPSFIGNDYFCESGTTSTDPGLQLYTNDPLWDGKGCGGSEGPCCNAPGIPWFHKVFNSATTDYIELRICADEERDNEDTPVFFYEIYVK